MMHTTVGVIVERETLVHYSIVSIEVTNELEIYKLELCNIFAFMQRRPKWMVTPYVMQCHCDTTSSGENTT